ncbi:MAG: Arc family DNA-binding protein [Paracoccus sp. (in: a-proteobacteria)]|nr:Arc family DNA-binding protein [Paracoccus sp. (in: a-proteobacteria)]
MSTKAGRGSDQFMIRLPDGMRDRIKAAADLNNRSMNGEIVHTLEEKYPTPVDPETEALLEWIFKRIPKADFQNFLQEMIDKSLDEGSITEQDIADGLVPGVVLRKRDDAP